MEKELAHITEDGWSGSEMEEEEPEDKMSSLQDVQVQKEDGQCQGEDEDGGDQCGV